MRSPFNVFASVAVCQAEIENLYKTNFMALSTRLAGLLALQRYNQPADDTHAQEHIKRRNTFSIHYPHKNCTLQKGSVCVHVYLYASIHIARRVE